MGHPFYKFCLFVMGLSVVSGCSSGGEFPTTIPVTGKVVYEGEPVEGAQVAFVSSNSDGRSARGKTDANGEFTMTTYFASDYSAEGVVPGSYAVTVSKFEERAAMTNEEMMKVMGSGQQIQPPKNELPSQYANAKKSPLKASVEEGQENHFEFTLTP